MELTSILGLIVKIVFGMGLLVFLAYSFWTITILKRYAFSKSYILLLMIIFISMSAAIIGHALFYIAKI
jgi:hypothetical protein